MLYYVMPCRIGMGVRMHACYTCTYRYIGVCVYLSVCVCVCVCILFLMFVFCCIVALCDFLCIAYYYLSVLFLIVSCFFVWFCYSFFYLLWYYSLCVIGRVFCIARCFFVFACWLLNGLDAVFLMLGLNIPKDSCSIYCVCLWVCQCVWVFSVCLFFFFCFRVCFRAAHALLQFRRTARSEEKRCLHYGCFQFFFVRSPSLCVAISRHDLMCY